MVASNITTLMDRTFFDFVEGDDMMVVYMGFSVRVIFSIHYPNGIL